MAYSTSACFEASLGQLDTKCPTCGGPLLRTFFLDTDTLPAVSEVDIQRQVPALDAYGPHTRYWGIQAEDEVRLGPSRYSLAALINYFGSWSRGSIGGHFNTAVPTGSGDQMLVLDDASIYFSRPPHLNRTSALAIYTVEVPPPPPQKKARSDKGVPRQCGRAQFPRTTPRPQSSARPILGAPAPSPPTQNTQPIPPAPPTPGAGPPGDTDAKKASSVCNEVLDLLSRSLSMGVATGAPPQAVTPLGAAGPRAGVTQITQDAGPTPLPAVDAAPTSDPTTHPRPTPFSRTDHHNPDGPPADGPASQQGPPGQEEGRQRSPDVPRKPRRYPVLFPVTVNLPPPGPAPSATGSKIVARPRQRPSTPVGDASAKQAPCGGGPRAKSLVPVVKP